MNICPFNNAQEEHVTMTIFHVLDFEPELLHILFFHVCD